jgi:hypothetical protein
MDASDELTLSRLLKFILLLMALCVSRKAFSQFRQPNKTVSDLHDSNSQYSRTSSLSRISSVDKRIP